MDNWNARIFVVPRANLPDLRSRVEANNPSLYFLFGDSDESTNQKLYIGETEKFVNRLSTHDSKKDFWNVAVGIIGGLDKAKIKYLEYLANKEASLVARFDLENSTAPAENKLSEFDQVSISEYFEKVKFVLSALGYPVFESISSSILNKKIYVLKRDGADAKAQLLEDGSLNVLKGSIARIKETKSFWGWSLAARRRFLEDGTIKDQGNNVSYVYTKDVLFKSPSAAAATTLGRPANGWTEWKDEQGNTLDENLRK